MKKLNRLLSFVLIISMLLCIPVLADKTNSYLEESGKLGDDVYYSYDKDAGTVRIYGSGPMWHFTDDSPAAFAPDDPLYDFFKITPFCYAKLNKVTIEDGVTTIGDELFCGSEITQIDVAASVNVVERMAFEWHVKSVYFYGDAPNTTDCFGEPKSMLLNDGYITIYHLPDAKGWDKIDVKKYVDHELVSAADQVKTFCGAPYSDVAGEAWCAEAVLKMWEEGIMNGTELDYFSPDASLTRGMMATILYRMAGEPEYIGGAGSYWFADVGEGSFCDKAIGWAHANGIIEGYTDGSFKPDRALNRQELAALLYRYDTTLNPATTTDGDTVSSATDAAKAADWDTVSSFAKEAMLWAVKEGIINGTDSTKLVLSPFGTASRAQIAVMLCRYLA